MNDLDLCLEVVQGHVNHCGINTSQLLELETSKFGTWLCTGHAKRAHKQLSLKVGLA